MQEHEITIAVRTQAMETVMTEVVGAMLSVSGLSEAAIQEMYRRVTATTDGVSISGVDPVESDHVAGEFQDATRYLVKEIESARLRHLRRGQ
ncbi:hypothetical protein DLM45_02415 [Hyphomicrobium methylovorum]|uniref:hypothetical protein n=1 Tax=Hyphomicrobium methylovorum TaxID=84 RepID=UPI0015E7CA6A|nr:hypothetical protein [Hyphomicrobium methylovorum]MBA2125080.1 hypothetical protein [Hyphomicrobium methylovorum]